MEQLGGASSSLCVSLPIDPLTGVTVQPRSVFSSLQCRDDALRAAGIATLLERLRRYEEQADSDASGNARGTLMVLLPTVLRLKHDCPFDDISSACSAYLAALARERGILLPQPAPVSAFISAVEVCPYAEEAGCCVRPLQFISRLRFANRQ